MQGHELFAGRYIRILQPRQAEARGHAGGVRNARARKPSGANTLLVTVPTIVIPAPSRKARRSTFVVASMVVFATGIRIGNEAIVIWLCNLLQSAASSVRA